MKREDSKPAAKPAPPPEDRGQVIDVAKSDGFIPKHLVEDEMQGLYLMAKEAPGPLAAISDSCLPILQARARRQIWSSRAPKAAASAAFMEEHIPLHQLIQDQLDVEDPDVPEPQGPLFDRVVSDNALVGRKDMTQSVRELMTKNPKFTSDAVLALPTVRKLLQEEVRQSPRPAMPVQQIRMRTAVEHLVDDKLYEGRIVKRMRLGVLVDIFSTGLGLLRWRCVRGIPNQLLKTGGYLANLKVTRKDQEKNRFSLKLEGIGFDHDTFEETNYAVILDSIHCWSELPGAPLVPRMISTAPPGFGSPLAPAPEAALEDAATPADAEPRHLQPREKRLRRWGKMGPRSTVQNL